MIEEINNALNTLKKGGIILYPTDTVWGIGCDATNYEGIERIFELKKRPGKKALICLVNDFNMLEQHVENIPEVAYDILKYADRPTTIIYDNPIRISENLIAKDNSLGIRVVQDRFCQELIRKLKRPIVSTSANLSEAKTPLKFEDITQEILDGVDYVVNLGRDRKSTKPSAIIKLKNDGTVKIIR